MPEISDEDLKAFNDAKAERDALKKEKSDAEAAAALALKNKKEQEDLDLGDKVKDRKKSDDEKATETKRLEAAITFSVKSNEFIKNNASLLPDEATEIFKQADKENYSNPIEKDQAIKSGLIKTFFSVQANHDLLTDTQKTQLAEYLKLTKDGRNEKAQTVYENLFEPALLNLRNFKKAEALRKGLGDSTDTETQYMNRMVKLSKQHYLGEKSQ